MADPKQEKTPVKTETANAETPSIAKEEKKPAPAEWKPLPTAPKEEVKQEEIKKQETSSGSDSWLRSLEFMGSCRVYKSPSP